MPNVLEKIAAYKRTEVETAKAQAPLAQLKSAALAQDKPRGFLSALRARSAQSPALIAEIKKASPSKGLIRPDFDPQAFARAYERGGASCLSVLTDQPSFQGHAQDLIDARAVCALPVLRKDFMLDPYQIYESRAMGADCVLLIMAMLDDKLARSLYRTARALDMDVLVETHDALEIERALALNPDMIGINNRDLKTFHTSLSTFSRLAPKVPNNVFLVAESGIFTSDDILTLTQSGAQGFLVGESLMRADNIELATRALLGRTPYKAG